MKSKHTEEQLNWLRDRLPEYESRAAAQVRGDAKGFALKCAEEYIVKWGLGTGPDAEKESQVKERIYTWFKNTSARGKEARRKHAQSKSERESAGMHSSPSMPTPASYQFMSDPNDELKKGEIMPFPSNRHESIKAPQGSPMSPHPHIVPGGIQTAPTPHGGVVMQPQASQIMVGYVQPASTNGAAPPITPVMGATPFPPLTQAFLQPGLSPQSLAQVVHSSSANQAFTTGLASAIQSLLYAATTLNAQNADNPGGAVEVIIDLMKRYKAMLPNLPVSLSHFGCAGPHAGVKALRVALRKNATWISYSNSGNAFVPPSPNNPSAAGSAVASRRPELPIHDQMHRTSIDRFRRKEYFIWAMIHSASYEVGLLGPSKNPIELGFSHDQLDDDDGSMKLAEAVAKDGFWETDESDWVAGALLFRAVVRKSVEDPATAMEHHRSAVSLKQEWEELVRAYEARWKEMRDESRQQAMEDALNVIRTTLDAIR